MKPLSALLVAATLGFAAPAFAQISPCHMESSTVATKVVDGVVYRQFSVAAEGCPSYQSLANAILRSMEDARDSVAIHVAAIGAEPVHFADVTTKGFVRTESMLLDADFATFRKREDCGLASVKPKCLYQAGVKALIALKDQPMKTAEKMAGK